MTSEEQPPISYADLHDRQDEVWSRLTEGKRALKRMTVLSLALEDASKASAKILSGTARQMSAAGKISEGSTVGLMLGECVTASETLTQSLNDLNEGLRMTVHKPLSASKAEILSTGKNLKDSAAKLQADIARLKKAYVEAQLKAKRAVDAYAKAEQEAAQLESMQPPPDQSKTNAARKKVQTALRAFTDADAAHQAAVKQCAERQINGSFQVASMLDQAASADGRRIETLQHGIGDFASQLQIFGNSLISVGLQLQQSAENIDVVGDMSAFVAAVTPQGDNEAEPRVRYVQATPSHGAPIQTSGSGSQASSAASIDTRTVLYDYTASADGCISCTAGQVVTVLNAGADWSTVRAGGVEGLVPTSYLSPAAEQTSPAAAAQPKSTGNSNEREMAYDFDPEDTSAGQLKTSAGEVVCILGTIDGGWVQVEVKGDSSRRGIVPESYLKSN